MTSGGWKISMYQGEGAEEVLQARPPYTRVHAFDLGCPPPLLADLARRAFEGCGVTGADDLRLCPPAKVLRGTPDETDLVLAVERELTLQGARNLQGLKQDMPVAQEGRMLFLCANGASFHHDVADETWAASLFAVLCLHAVDADLVFPATNDRTPLRPGVAIVFDPCLPHGICRTGDSVFTPSSFGNDAAGGQAFLSGGLHLTRAQWEEIGCGWGPDSADVFAAKTDLRDIEFHSRTGDAQRARHRWD